MTATGGSGVLPARGTSWPRRVGPWGSRLLAVALVLAAPSMAFAEWQVKPFFGLAFAGGTTLVDLEDAVGSSHVAVGITAAMIGEVVGVEADLGYAPGFFQSGDRNLLVSSSAMTLTGNLVLAVPRRMVQYTLRPYFVGGGGLMHASSETYGGALGLGSTLPAVDVGGGVTGFLTRRFGVSWDVRYFRSVRGRDSANGLSFGAEELSFWRANMALAIRF